MQPNERGDLALVLEEMTTLPPPERDPLAAARLRAVRIKRELLERAGGAWSTGEVPHQLGAHHRRCTGAGRGGRYSASGHRMAITCIPLSSSGATACCRASLKYCEHSRWKTPGPGWSCF
jgi:hypothetical protein